LARPALAQRLVTNFYAHDERFHDDLKRRAESELRTHRTVRTMKRTSGTCSEVEWIKSGSEVQIAGQPHRLARNRQAGAPALQRLDAPNTVRLSANEWQESIEKLAVEFNESHPREAASRNSADRTRPRVQHPVASLNPSKVASE